MEPTLSDYLHFLKWVLGTYFIAGFGSMTVGEFVTIPWYTGLAFTVSSLPLGFWLGYMRSKYPHDSKEEPCNQTTK